MLFTGPVGGMLEQVGAELLFLRLKPLEFNPNVVQAVYGMSVLHHCPPYDV